MYRWWQRKKRNALLGSVAEIFEGLWRWTGSDGLISSLINLVNFSSEAVFSCLRQFELESSICRLFCLVYVGVRAVWVDVRAQFRTAQLDTAKWKGRALSNIVPGIVRISPVLAQFHRSFLRSMNHSICRGKFSKIWNLKSPKSFDAFRSFKLKSLI